MGTSTVHLQIKIYQYSYIKNQLINYHFYEIKNCLLVFIF